MNNFNKMQVYINLLKNSILRINENTLLTYFLFCTSGTRSQKSQSDCCEHSGLILSEKFDLFLNILKF